MLLWRLSLVFTYLAASGATAANLRSFFRGQKLLKLLTVGYALHEMPLSVGSKLELLWTCLLPNFRILPRILLTHALVCVLCRLPCIHGLHNGSVCIIVPRVMHFSAFISIACVSFLFSLLCLIHSPLIYTCMHNRTDTNRHNTN